MKIKIFFIVFLISLPFWWGINVLEQNLENFFFLEIAKNNPEFFIAQVSQYPHQNIEKEGKELSEQELEEELSENEKLLEQESENSEISAQSIISVLVDSQDKEEIIFEKDISKKLPIASLTKLMTALIALETYDMDQKVIISKEAMEQPEEKGKLSPGENLSVENLLHIMLIESSNDAAYALSEGKIVGQEEYIGEESFVAMMNFKAKELGLENTHFVNSVGIGETEEPKHYSTSKDLVKLSQYIMKEHPQIFEISRKKSYEVLNSDGSVHHFIASNTNKLLDLPIKTWWGIEIIGCKTGWTPEAQGCLLLVMKKENQDGYLINVILGSEDRFEEMKKLIYQTISL
ncbi:D-alanyl-D-alanine carboxypeptidase [Candidatus Parcubacteria bacterium]|nr:D-alanyl-D-alanine carboxypeptidase [Candidatus Parcubacteria bacterium]